jgi:hypothetical protein
MSSTETLTKANSQLVELRRHQVYRLERRPHVSLIRRLRRGVRARLGR